MDGKCYLKPIRQGQDHEKQGEAQEDRSSNTKGTSGTNPVTCGRGYNAPSVSRAHHLPKLSPPEQQELPPKPRYESHHLLNCSLEYIFYQIRDNGLLRPLKPIKKYPNMKRNLKYCKFHEDFSHNTSECFSLCEEIESLILSGYLKEFVVGMRETRKSMEQDKSKHIIDNNPNVRHPKDPRKGYMFG